MEIRPVQERFEKPLAENRPWMLQKARHLCLGSSSDPEDLVQDAFVRFVDAFQDTPLPKEAGCAAWLATAMRNSFISQGRKAEVHERASTDPSFRESVAGPSEPRTVPAYDRITDGAVERAVQGLSPKLRVVFEANAAGKRYDEIAAELGIPRGTVAKRLHDARLQLRKKLKAVYQPEEP